MILISQNSTKFTCTRKILLNFVDFFGDIVISTTLARCKPILYTLKNTSINILDRPVCREG
jgi:hypothetical protein